MKHTIEVPIVKCPSTPLNLQFDVTYAPRIPTHPFIAFRAVELSGGCFQVESFGDNGYVSVARVASLGEAWQRLAQCLRMDVPE